MRPKSIILFERLFLVSILLNALAAFLGFQDTLAQMEQDAAMVSLGWGASILMITAVVYVLVLLLLYYLIARRANTVAKWILVVIVLLGLSALPGAIAVQSGIELGVAVAANLLAAAAAVCLFLPDARKWLGSKPHSHEGE